MPYYLYKAYVTERRKEASTSGYGSTGSTEYGTDTGVGPRYGTQSVLSMAYAWPLPLLTLSLPRMLALLMVYLDLDLGFDLLTLNLQRL